MAESSRSKVGRVEEDIISNLPRDMKETILCFLPIRDAVRTGILSTKWRHCWTTIPRLIFDNQFLDGIRNKFNSYHNSKEKEHNFVSAIDKVLLLHSGPILKFSLKVIGGCDAQTIHDHIAHWILLFSRTGIKQLSLHNYNPGGITAHDFSSLGLTYLSLTGFRFLSTKAFGEFTHLTYLQLQLVDATNFGQSIFNCPVLEKLTLICCTELSLTNFHAPNLKSLYEIAQQITLAKLENLARFYFSLHPYSGPTQTKTSNLVKVLSSLHKIKKFSIGLRFMEYLAEGGCPNRLSNPLPYLKTLYTYYVNFTHTSEIACLLCLIRSAPYLRTLHINASDDADNEINKNYWIEDSEDYPLDHLRNVTFTNFKGVNTELKLVKFLLGLSPLLKTMYIHCSKLINQDAELAMALEMLGYSRASSRAQIKLRTTC